MTERQTLAAAALLLLTELAAILMVVVGLPLAALLLHVAASAAAIALARRHAALDPATATMRITAVLLPFLGPAAAAASVVILAVVVTRHDPIANAALWHDHLFPNLAADDLSERTEAINRHQAIPDANAEIESFFDVLRWGALPEQEHILSLISRSFRPEFAPVLRAGLAVADLGLRAQAAAGLSLLETRTSTRIVELSEAHRNAAPEHRGAAAIVLSQSLANAAHSGLYDEVRTVEMRHQIVETLAPLCQANPADPAMNAMLGRTLIQLGELDRAVATLESAADADPSNEAAFAWLAEGVFRQADYGRLTDLLTGRNARVRTLVRQDGPLAPALRFWADVA